MNITDTELLYLCGYSVVLGLFLGICYGVFAFVRIVVSPLSPQSAVGRALSDLAAFVSDVSFSLFAGVCVALLFFGANSGRVRLFGIVGCGVGFSIYHFSIGRWIISRVAKYTAGVRRMIGWIYRYTIGIPLSLLTKMIAACKINIRRKKRKAKDEKLEFLG